MHRARPRTVRLLSGLPMAALCALVWTPCARAAATMREEPVEEGTLYRMENERVSLLVDPSAGGAVISYRDKQGGNVDLISDKPPRGLCIDHFQSQRWPGEMFNATYEAETGEQGPDECVLTLRYTVTGQWQESRNERIQGLSLVKTYTLCAGSPALECRVRLTAPADGANLFAYWQQNILFAGGQYDRVTDKSYRPSTRGVRVKGGADWGHTGNEEWLRDFTAGWMALVDTTRKSGLVVLPEYDELDVLYMNQGNHTVEPMYRMTYLPAGQSVEYTNLIVPVAGLGNVVSATPDYIAGYAVRAAAQGKGELEVSVVRSANPPRPAEMRVGMLSAQTVDQVRDVGQLSFPAPGDTPVTRSLSYADVGPDPLVLRVETIVGRGPDSAARNSFEEYVNGTYKWGENIRTDMSTPVYRGERPEQKLDLRKPEQMRIRDVWGDQVWYAEGLLDDVYGVAAAEHMTRQRHDNTVRDREFVSYNRSFLSRLSGFPHDYEKLLQYDLVILGGVKREALGNLGLEMLSDYLGAGGGMLVLGGPMAYGASRLAGTKLVEHWPVRVQDAPFNLERLDDAVIRPVADAPFLEHLDFSAEPRVVYLHRVELRPGAETVLTASGRPFLVTGEEGRRRVACILGAPMGSMRRGHTPFWEWSEWTAFLRQLNWWLMKDLDDRRFARE